jgi:purine-cytosine permease-like protein
VALLVGETDEAFANIYSAAVSSQNLRDRIPQRGAIVAVVAAAAGLAAWLGTHESSTFVYETFLFLLGSIFVPLFGMFVADYFLLRRRPHRTGGTFDGGGPDDVRSRSNWPAVAAWIIGFLVYQWSVPTGPEGWRSAVETLFADWLSLPFPLWSSVAGASLPAFGVASAAYLAFALAVRATRRGAVEVSP